MAKARKSRLRVVAAAEPEAGRGLNGAYYWWPAHCRAGSFINARRHKVDEFISRSGPNGVEGDGQGAEVDCAKCR